LRYRIFFALFVAQLVSSIGTLMQNVGSAWLMGDLRASTLLVALVQTATFLPVLLVVIGLAVLTHSFWLVLLVVGVFWWAGLFRWGRRHGWNGRQGCR